MYTPVLIMMLVISGPSDILSKRMSLKVFTLKLFSMKDNTNASSSQRGTDLVLFFFLVLYHRICDICYSIKVLVLLICVSMSICWVFMFTNYIIVHIIMFVSSRSIFMIMIWVLFCMQYMLQFMLFIMYVALSIMY